MVSIDCMFTSTNFGLNDTSGYLYISASKLVQNYSAAPQIEKQMKERRKEEKLIMAIIQGLGLMSTASLGLFGAANAEIAAVAPVKAVLDLTVNSYISATGILKESMSDEPHLSDDLEAHIQSSLTEFGILTRDFHEHHHRHKEVQRRRQKSS
jgi:hypothetical protein